MDRLSEMERDFRDYEERIERLKKAANKIEGMEKAELPADLNEPILTVKSRLKLPLEADWVENKLIEIEGRLTPKIKITIAEEPLPVDQWNNAELAITNNGDTLARNISITVPDSLEIQATLTLPFLLPGKNVSLPFRLRPHQIGESEVKLDIACENIIGFKCLFPQNIKLIVIGSLDKIVKFQIL